MRTAHPLEPYVPRVLSEWDLDSPDSKWQAIDGSLCFVDISGFTKLSEALARRGRIGAEELTEVLDRVFGEMLRLAYNRGGSLLKFGGDALLLLFEGEQHTLQATCSAVEMRAALREAVKIPTSVGRIRLRMSVGVHTGLIDLFCVGESHRELIVTGPTATETTEMEAAADAGEIVISNSLREALPAGSTRDRKGGGWILNWRSPRVDPIGTVPRRLLTADEYAACVPTQLRQHLSLADTEPEHRIATVGFVEFKGIQDEAERSAMAGVAKGLDLLVRAVQEAVDGEGVTFLATDIDEDGGKVILTTGVPVTQEDDEGRMLRALRLIADSEQIFPLKIGTNRGHVFAGEIGTDIRRTYTVMGDTVNLAARLMAAAPPGAVYAAPGVLDRSRTLYETTPLEPFHVKGKRDPVQAYAVGAETGGRRSHVRGVLPFVGRNAELGKLIEAAEHASRRGVAVTISGPTGIGKSRLVEEALADRDIETLMIRAEPNSIGNPYWAFRDPMRALLRIERLSQAEMAESLRSAVGERYPDLLDELPLLATVLHIDVDDNDTTADIEPRFRPERIADAVLRLLDRALPSAAVIVAEDGHWMDEASHQLIDRIAGHETERGWLVILTTREVDDNGVGSVVELGPLSAEEARYAVMTATEGAPLRPFELDVVVGRAGGNPLYLGEIVRVVRETGSVEDLPDSLDAVVGAQIDSLPPLPRRLLRMSSVLGRSFRKVVLQALLEDEQIELDAATTRALSRFIEDDGTRFRFRHATVHQVAYEGLPYRRRRVLHARAGATIERLAGDDTDAVAEFLALHYSNAHQYDRAWQYAVIAADRAKERYANVEAAAQYRVASEAARQLPQIPRMEAGRIYEALGDVCEVSGLYEDAEKAYASARKLLSDDSQAQGRLMAKQGLIREKAGKLSGALSWFRRGLNVVDDTQGDARAELSVAYAGIRFRQGKFHEAIDWCERVLEDPGATDVQRAHSLHLLVTAYAHVGSPKAVDAGLRAIEIYERLGDLVGLGNVLNNLGVNAFYRGNWDESTDYHTRARDARRRAGHVIGAAASVNNLAEIKSDQGKLDEAESMFREALYVFESSGFPVGVALASANLGRTITRMGRLDEGWTYLEAGRQLFAGMGAQAFIFETDVKVVEHHLFARRQGQARDLARRVLAEMPSDDSTLMSRSALNRMFGLCMVIEQRLDAALEHFELSLKLAGEASAQFESALTFEAMARTLRHDPRAGEWNQRQSALFDRLGVVATPMIPLLGEREGRQAL